MAQGHQLDHLPQRQIAFLRLHPGAQALVPGGSIRFRTPVTFPSNLPQIVGPSSRQEKKIENLACHVRAWLGEMSHVSLCLLFLGVHGLEPSTEDSNTPISSSTMSIAKAPAPPLLSCPSHRHMLTVR